MPLQFTGQELLQQALAHHQVILAPPTQAREGLKWDLGLPPDVFMSLRR